MEEMDIKDCGNYFVESQYLLYIYSNASLEGRERHYHQYRSESDRMRCETSDNVCRKLQNCC